MKIWAILILALILATPMVFAGDEDVFDDLLEPVMKIYNFVKYSATVLAMLYLTFAGITYLMSGNDQVKREQAKAMATYVIIGLIVIWSAPLLVEYLTK